MSKRTTALTFLALALSVGLATIGPATTSAAGAVVVRGEIGFFYDSLAPYGSWVDVAAYGDVWVPRVPTWWRPYSDGHWVFTDDGWCWVDDEPWGWATFHYGRWYFDPDYGWAWVPGTVWAPAWVAWRYGDGYIGWAPLPPEVGWNVSFGLAFSGGDFDRVIGPRYWCFVDQRHFTDPRIYGYLAPTTRNVTYVRMTQNITNYTVVNNRVFDRGVDVRQVERFSGRPVPRLHIVDRNAPGPVRATGRELNVYRPSLKGRPENWRGPRVEAPRTRGVVERPHAEAVQRSDGRLQPERTRLQGQERARVSRGVSPQPLRSQQNVERRTLPHAPQPERRVVERRMQSNPRAQAIRGRAPDRHVQQNPPARVSRVMAPQHRPQQNAGAHVSKGKVVEHRVPQNTGANAKGSKGKGKGGGGNGRD